MSSKRKNKYIKSIFFLLFILFFKSSYLIASNFQKIIISEDVSKRIDQYINKKIYSYVYDNTIINITSLAMAISDDGLSSVIGYCREKKELCRTNSPYLFQIKIRCEKISKKNCEIVIKDDFLIIDNKKIKLNKENKKKYFLINKNKLVGKKKQSDFEIENTKDYESDWNS